MSLVGQHIGRYRILEQLGSGGMSVVYKGFDTALDREVAVKVLHPHLAGKEDSRRRLAREAKAVAKLQHPNILEVFDFAASDSENAYIVTEYIRGHTLRHYAENHSFEPPEIAAMVIHEVSTALAHAHEAGIIHRDLKPENVMVREDGVVKLMDFGIAKVLDRDDRMTMTGTLVGSPAHMAPEIIEGHEVGPEADVFSLGTMLYYFATGQLPFSGPHATSTLKKILDGAYEDPRRIVPALSDELAEIISKCLAREPSSRYPEARQLQDALVGYLASVGFPRASEELSWFFVDPNAYRAEMVGRLVENRMQAATLFLREKRPAKALANLNQVLALHPGYLPARELLRQMNSAQRRRQAIGRWLITPLAAAVAIAAFAGAYAFYQRLAEPSATVTATFASGLSPSEQSAAPDPSPGPSATESVEKPAEERGRSDRQTIAKAAPAHSLPDRSKAESRGQITPVKLTLQFRPFAYAQIDDQARRDELPQHEFSLNPGEHTLVYGCQFCVEETQKIRVTEHQEPIRIQVQPKPSLLSFRFEPSDAMVSIAGERKAAAETERAPFRISFPKGVAKRQRVEFEIARPGYEPKRDAVSVDPGQSKTIEGALVPE
jgi:serine/threonine-protein kinase